mmetsp:Transcript_147270/g.257296  ORF Transcript_147270/g.257296 Transcript_147270/m.257296 type:complete len:131 (-) Transcript_147270:59-451(-)
MLSRIARIARVAPTVHRVVQPGAVRPAVVFGQKRWGGGGGAPSADGLHFVPVEEVQERVLKTIQEFDKITKTVKPEYDFANDLGLDSLDVVEVVMALEWQFQVEMHVSEAEQIHSVQDAIDFFSKHPMAH